MPRSKRKVVAKTKTLRKASINTESRSRGATRRQADIEGSMQNSTEAAAEATNPPFFFWKETEKEGGFLSPWYKSQFKHEGATYDSVGHAIMAEKARIFGDKVPASPNHVLLDIMFLMQCRKYFNEFLQQKMQMSRRLGGTTLRDLTRVYGVKVNSHCTFTPCNFPNSLKSNRGSHDCYPSKYEEIL